MKNEKFCFSKGTGLIALVGVVLVGLAVVMASLATQKTSTSTRASEVEEWPCTHSFLGDKAGNANKKVYVLWNGNTPTYYMDKTHSQLVPGGDAKKYCTDDAIYKTDNATCKSIGGIRVVLNASRGLNPATGFDYPLITACSDIGQGYFSVKSSDTKDSPGTGDFTCCVAGIAPTSTEDQKNNNKCKYPAYTYNAEFECKNECVDQKKGYGVTPGKESCTVCTMPKGNQVTYECDYFKAMSECGSNDSLYTNKTACDTANKVNTCSGCMFGTTVKFKIP